MLNEVRELGFEYAELGHGIRLSLVDGIQRAVAAGEIKISSVHNFCPLPLQLLSAAPDYYLLSARREREREQALKHTLRTLDCAAAVGAKAVVLHMGMVSMRNYTERLLDLCSQGEVQTPRFQRLRDKALKVRDRKRPKDLEQLFRTLEEVVPRAREMGLKLGMETRLGIEDIPMEDEVDQLLAQFGSDTLAYWHDVGHAQLKENMGLAKQETILERFRGRTAGMHLQDFAPPACDHLPPGYGTFDFARLAGFATDHMILTWEIHHEWTAAQIADKFRPAHASITRSVHS